jgi:hypothetical protein
MEDIAGIVRSLDKSGGFFENPVDFNDFNIALSSIQDPEQRAYWMKRVCSSPFNDKIMGVFGLVTDSDYKKLGFDKKKGTSEQREQGWTYYRRDITNTYEVSDRSLFFKGFLMSPRFNRRRPSFSGFPFIKKHCPFSEILALLPRIDTSKEDREIIASVIKKSFGVYVKPSGVCIDIENINGWSKTRHEGPIYDASFSNSQGGSEVLIDILPEMREYFPHGYGTHNIKTFYGAKPHVHLDPDLSDLKLKSLNYKPLCSMMSYCSFYDCMNEKDKERFDKDIDSYIETGSYNSISKHNSISKKIIPKSLSPEDIYNIYSKCTDNVISVEEIIHSEKFTYDGTNQISLEE